MPEQFTFNVVYGPYTQEDIDLCAKGLGYGNFGPQRTPAEITTIQFVTDKVKELNANFLAQGKIQQEKQSLVSQASQVENAVKSGVAQTINIEVKNA